ncbi:MAG: HAD family hydrolase [Dehalococcoidales bacterium]|nr:HAD family hydrolase [Dehalococcoidales bacterium]
MSNLSGIKIISLDLFRTLVTVDDSYEWVWRQFLGANYTNEKARRYWDRAGEIISANINAVEVRGEFKNVFQIFEDTYTALFDEIHLDYAPHIAAGVLSQGHKNQRVYEDVAPFFNRLQNKFEVCLSTDADCDLVQGYKDIYPFGQLFISEEIKSYKSGAKFFEHVLDHYKVPPQQILHIGDSHRDIIQPKKLGIKTCWINRDNQIWRHDVKPDFEVKSLLEIADLLG